MASNIHITGMVLKSMQIGESDRRITILTTDRGKIGAFARGAKRPGSSFMAVTEPFVFGEFEIIEGHSSYNVAGAKVTNYFEELRSDFEASCYGFYFLEFADYYGRENADDKEMLKLLYQSVRALCRRTIDLRLIRCIYEIKILVINGDGVQNPQAYNMSPAAVYTINYIVSSPIVRLYTFTVSDEVLPELETFCRKMIGLTIDRKFKSLDILENIIV